MLFGWVPETQLCEVEGREGLEFGEDGDPNSRFEMRSI